ncbi:SDR family NAD(P)-dependent oxidoreductase [Acanthopleuribacter pedis]|uniref:SDR family NAD(P)-dependent oxidoreductase n=1 Tax=Acanthopleuribacter pedis TaxID=442870 RepID=A0A8J7QAG2_9BACT|nr:SDR family NAD(P)-dependent oxidoreductase [Acanthopleuribacter pedis]MBO1321796.1 SDR family NAD(P)-dependent oxidoreductase [Acanthopleuribacter pedis]
MTAKLAAPSAGKTFELDLLPENLLFRDFQLFDQAVFPPMLFFELLIKVAREELAVKHPVFRNTHFHNFLLPRAQPQIMRLDFAGGDSFYKVVVSSRPAGCARGQGETLHLMSECHSGEPTGETFDAKLFKRAGDGPHELQLPPGRDSRRHLRLGPLCLTEGGLTYGAGETLAELYLSADQQPLWSHFQVPPAFLQTAFHIAADNGRINPTKVLLPKSIASFEAHQALGDSCALVFPNALQYEPDSDPPRRLLDFSLFNPYGNLAVRVSGICLEEVTGPLRRMGNGEHRPTPAAPVEKVLAYQSTWVDAPLADASPPPNNLVVFANEQTMGNALAEQFPDLKIRFIRTGEEYGVYTEQNIGIRPDQTDHYERALDFCLGEEQADLNLVYLWGWEDLGWEEKERVGRGSLQIHTLKTATQLYYLTRAAKREAQRRKRSFRILCLVPSPLFEGIAAFAASVHHEEARLKFRIIKVDSHHTGEVVDIIARELDPRLPDQEPVSYLKGLRRIRRLKPLPLEHGQESPLLQARDTYLITGGSGFVGSILAEYLGARYRANLVLVAKNPITDDVTQLMERISEHGGRAVYHQADVSDPEDMYTALADGKRLFGTIDGVFHCAGCRQGEHANQDRLETFESVIWPKVNGTLVLDQVLSGEPLKFFITFSSFPGALGGPRSPFSSLADGFQAGFAGYRRDWEQKQGRKSKNLALCWANWFSSTRSPDPEAGLMPPMHVETALGCLEQALGAKPNHLFLVTAPPAPEGVARNTAAGIAGAVTPETADTATAHETEMAGGATEPIGVGDASVPTEPGPPLLDYQHPGTVAPPRREKKRFLLVAASCRFPGGKDRFALSTQLFPEDLPSPTQDPLLAQDPDYEEQARLFLPGRNTLDEVYLRLGSFRTTALDPRLAIWLASARQALDNAGLNDRMLREQRVGIFLAVSWSLWDQVPNGHAHKLAAYAAHFLGATGPVLTLIGEGPAGSQVVQLGLQALAADQCEFALVGAVHLLPHAENHKPDAERARIPAEACVAMVLAENDQVEPRWLPNLAEFLHFDMQFEARNQALSIRDQVDGFHRQTQLRPNQITHVEWAGDSSALTPWRNHLAPAYTAANALGGPSVRELIGNSGPCESLLAMLRAVNWLDEPAKRTARAAAGSKDPAHLAVPDSYAAVYGVYSDGSRAQFCLTPGTPAGNAAPPDQPMVFLTSATNHACLSAWVKRLDEHCRNVPESRLARIAAALRARQPHPCRLAVIAASVEELHQRWHDFLRGRTKQGGLFFSGAREEEEPHHTAYTGLSGAADLWVNGGDPIWPDAENLIQVRMLELPPQPTAKHAYSLDPWLHRNPKADAAFYAKTMSLEDIAPLAEPLPSEEETDSTTQPEETVEPAPSESTTDGDTDLSARERIKRMQKAHADTNAEERNEPVITIKDLTGEEPPATQPKKDETLQDEEQYLATHLPEDMGNFVGFGDAEAEDPAWYQSGPEGLLQFSPDDTIPPDEFPDFHAAISLASENPEPAPPRDAEKPASATPDSDANKSQQARTSSADESTERDPNFAKTVVLDEAALDADMLDAQSEPSSPEDKEDIEEKPLSEDPGHAFLPATSAEPATPPPVEPVEPVESTASETERASEATPQTNPETDSQERGEGIAPDQASATRHSESAGLENETAAELKPEQVDPPEKPDTEPPEETNQTKANQKPGETEADKQPAEARIPESVASHNSAADTTIDPALRDPEDSAEKPSEAIPPPALPSVSDEAVIFDEDEESTDTDTTHTTDNEPGAHTEPASEQQETIENPDPLPRNEEQEPADASPPKEEQEPADSPTSTESSEQPRHEEDAEVSDHPETDPPSDAQNGSEPKEETHETSPESEVVETASGDADHRDETTPADQVDLIATAEHATNEADTDGDESPSVEDATKAQTTDEADPPARGDEETGTSVDEAATAADDEPDHGDEAPPTDEEQPVEPEREWWLWQELPAYTQRFHLLHWGQQKRPLFFLPSLDGSCNWAEHLAKGPLLSHPFHFMAAPGAVDETEPQSLLRPIAAEFADYASRHSGEHDPILIAWSSGSTLLFETCRHLRRSQQNCVLILLDGLIPGGHAVESLLNLNDGAILREQVMILSAALAVRSQGRFKGLEDMGRKAQLKQVTNFLVNQTHFAVKKKDLRGLLEKRLDMCHFNRKNILKHRLEPTFAPVPLFLYNSNDQTHPTGVASIWRSLMNGVTIHEWRGNCHAEHLFYEPNISFLCRYLEQQLTQLTP